MNKIGYIFFLTIFTITNINGMLSLSKSQPSIGLFAIMEVTNNRGTSKRKQRATWPRNWDTREEKKNTSDKALIHKRETL